jgi:hypothetical protein
MRLETGCYLRHRRVTWLVLAEPDEAAAASDLEGATGVIDGVSDIYGRSLSDSLGATANPARAATSATVRK